MRAFKDLNRSEKRVVADRQFDYNLEIAASGLLGFAVKKLAPTKENLKRFQEQFTGHPLCGCVACLELGKSFAMSKPDVKEEIITVSMDEIESGKYE